MFYCNRYNKNTKVLIANDINKNRVKAVVGNFHRMGIANSVVTTDDGRHILQVSNIYLFRFYCLGQYHRGKRIHVYFN